MRTYTGKFIPRNPKKYKGDPTNIIYRSSWELKFMFRIDLDPNVISWGSEEIVIPYRSPIDNKIHRYFVDFILTIINKQGIKETILIEIKPKIQTAPPKVQKKITKKYVSEVKTWGVNEAKWKAAKEFCEDRKWKFQILTEKELGVK
jgi:hypothetical protein